MQHRIGRVQRQVRRLFIGNGGQPVQIAELLAYCYPRIDRPEHWHRTNVYRAVRRFAVAERDGRRVTFHPSPELQALIHGASAGVWLGVARRTRTKPTVISDLAR
jgi:hypothetical protein